MRDLVLDDFRVWAVEMRAPLNYQAFLQPPGNDRAQAPQVSSRTRFKYVVYVCVCYGSTVAIYIYDLSTYNSLMCPNATFVEIFFAAMNLIAVATRRSCLAGQAARPKPLSIFRNVISHVYVFRNPLS